MTAWVVAGVCAAVPSALAQAPSPEPVLALRAGAWDQSVRLEREGKLEEARDLLIRAWGPNPEGYEVTVRLAWLSLKMGDSERAVAWYQRARTLAGAGPEASRGLASAHTQRGYENLEAWDREAAREDFRHALALDPGRQDAEKGLEIAGPETHLDPELWAAFLHQSLPRNNWTGWALFTQLPWQIDDSWRLRVAYRYVGARVEEPPAPPPPPGPGAPAPRSQQTTTAQSEIYTGLQYRSRWLDLEPIGFAVFPDDESTVLGAGFQLRFGKRFGALVEGASMDRERGWSHQAVPGLYYWPTDSFGLAAGLRYTSDADGEDASGWAGLSLVSDRTELHVRAHAGVERWAFSADQPSILTIDPETTSGGEAALLVPLSKTWQLGVQGDVERVRLDGETGMYFGAGLGLRWSPFLERGTHR